MRLHENKKLFKQSIAFTAQQKGIKDIYIEKDYWVTLALHTIFNSEAKEYAVFKGGTALSKCYGIIERFSEDIDLVVLNQEGDTPSQLKKKIRNIAKIVETIMPEIDIPEITNKKGMIRKTAHTYAKQFKGDYGQVRDVIIIESTSLGYHEPFTQKEISTYIFEMMKETDQLKIAADYNLLPFEVRVLDPTRTFCEKIMSLVRFSHSENPIKDLIMKVRHLYDLHQLLSLDDILSFFMSTKFDNMLLKVAQDDVEGYKSGNEWLTIHPKEAIIFASPKETWSKIKNPYLSDFKNMVYGELPNEKDILQSIETIAKRLKKITWNIKTKSS